MDLSLKIKEVVIAIYCRECKKEGFIQVTPLTVEVANGWQICDNFTGDGNYVCAECFEKEFGDGD